jgi:hypothetical protein
MKNLIIVLIFLFSINTKFKQLRSRVSLASSMGMPAGQSSNVGRFKVKKHFGKAFYNTQVEDVGKELYNPFYGVSGVN